MNINRYASPVSDKSFLNRHTDYMRIALQLAQKSPPKSTNYRVGALLVDGNSNTIISTGYTLECEGNTHAEQCCLIKLAAKYRVQELDLENLLPNNTILYTTLEPCNLRLSGADSCVDRILKLSNKIKAVYVGSIEPDTFVVENAGRRKLETAGIKVYVVEGLKKEILEVATAGHC
ncbi:Bifunctional protein RIB2 [Erysiphe neolycopersici]|uniref:Bifunctional protein RIB2 n=1 Tax=Erysiphe neolycopersici TaxID=212602 RepID=A0A420HRB3_9PEZI|nr:Bifunctional protein RIB2 [Erysiphe neolycopersici]